MKAIIRMPQQLDAHIREDLSRVHRFASERIGFIGGTTTRISDAEYLIVLKDYLSVADGDYVEDDTVGARINGNAIRKIMKYILETKNGGFHVHMHLIKGVPKMSSVDKREIPPIIKTFSSMLGTTCHGIVLRSKTNYSAFIAMPGQSTLVEPDRISIVGFPLFLNI
jgi:hypothetical protein